MELLQREHIHSLIEPRTAPCISIYIPTERAAVETLQNPIRFKNQLREVERRLAGYSLRPLALAELLNPLRALAGNYDFWQHQADGLALFRSADHMRYFRLPFAFEELAVVSERFHIKPLLSLLAWDSRFYVLALSRNSVRLLECSRYAAREIELPAAVPASLAEAQATPEAEAPHLQMRSVGLGPTGARTGIFHGRGGAVEEDKEALERYFREIDKGLHEVLREQRAPLVLAGVDYFFPIYRSVSTYSHIAPEGVSGSVDGMRPEELHRKAVAAVQPLFTGAEERSLGEYHRRLPEGRAASGLAQVLPAAHHGRVDVLFVALGMERWGRFDPETGAVELRDEPAAGDEDLLDLASIQTFLNGGSVFPVAQERVPGGAPVAAVLRY